MIIAVHALVGAAIGSVVDNNLAAAGFGLVSHYVLDAIPHWDVGVDFELGTPDFNKENKNKGKPKNWNTQFKIMSILHLFLGFFLVRKILTEKLLRVFLGAFFSIVPDIYEYLTMMFGKNRWPAGHPFHTRDVKSWYGVLTQVITALAAIFILSQNI